MGSRTKKRANQTGRFSAGKQYVGPASTNNFGVLPPIFHARLSLHFFHVVA